MTVSIPIHLNQLMQPSLTSLPSRNMASPRPRHRRYPLPRPHGHIRCHLPRTPLAHIPRRHSQHLRAACAWLLRPDRLRRLPLDHRNEHEPVSWSARGRLHGHCTRLHLTFRRWQLRQRSHRHFPPGLHLLLVDQGRQGRKHYVGRSYSPLLRIHGQRMGWIRFHYKPAASARLCVDLHGSFQPEAVRQLHHLVRSWNVG
jgi:hypothetical protein